jgi:hypothetical protein
LRAEGVRWRRSEGRGRDTVDSGDFICMPVGLGLDSPPLCDPVRFERIVRSAAERGGLFFRGRPQARMPAARVVSALQGRTPRSAFSAGSSGRDAAQHSAVRDIRANALEGRWPARQQQQQRSSTPGTFIRFSPAHAPTSSIFPPECRSARPPARTLAPRPRRSCRRRARVGRGRSNVVSGGRLGASGGWVVVVVADRGARPATQAISEEERRVLQQLRA